MPSSNAEKLQPAMKRSSIGSANSHETARIHWPVSGSDTYPLKGLANTQNWYAHCASPTLRVICGRRECNMGSKLAHT